MPDYFLGVDGGQSSTTALIADEEGRVLGCGRSGPCNHVSAEEARARFIRVILDCVGQACAAADLPEEVEFEGACLGFSGGPVDKDPIIAGILRIRHRLVTHDALIALTGATAGAPGVIVIGGTGSISFGRNAEGKMARVGGWGYVYGDEGGGFDITRQALRAALRMEEGWGPATSLRALLLEQTGAASANELLHRFYTPDFARPRIAALSQVVEQAASAGDLVAQDILSVAAQQLALLTISCRRLLFKDDEAARIAWIGGVFRAARLLDRFRTLLSSNPLNQSAPPLHNPAAGALLEAYRAAARPLPSLTNLPESEK
jgi:N-acetylglucosamine kinase-like BadF-type ATPase